MKLTTYNNYIKESFNWSKGSVPPIISKSNYEAVEIPEDLMYKDKIGVQVSRNTRSGKNRGYNVDPKIKDQFLKKIVYISSLLEVHPNWMMDVIRYETARTFAADIKNTTSSGTGLIQFMDEASAQEIFGLADAGKIPTDPIRQLDFVYAYLKHWKGSKDIKSVTDLYLLIFTPGNFSKSDDHGFKESYIKKNPGNFGYYGKDTTEFGTMKDFKAVIAKRNFKDTINIAGNFNLQMMKDSDIESRRSNRRDNTSTKNSLVKVKEFKKFDSSKIKDVSYIASLNPNEFIS